MRVYSAERLACATPPPAHTQGAGARREVSELVGGLQVLAEQLALPEDRLLALVEGAQVRG